jgi:hypothetical protein
MSFTGHFLLIFLVTLATFLLGILGAWFTKKPRWLRRRGMLPAVVIALIFVVAFIGTIPANKQSTDEKSGGTSTSPENSPAAPGGPSSGYWASPPGVASAPAIKPFIAKTGYVLRRSESPLTNDEDKVDLDTGCPGWGDMHPHIGPSRCGETADLILDQEGIHSADDRPRFVELDHDSAGDYTTCRAGLTANPARSLSQLEVTTLRADERICTRTDMDNIALVTIQAVKADTSDQLQRLKVDFVVWRADG